jgi:tape measure domain-containing protein
MAQEQSLRLGVDSRPAEQGARRATGALASLGAAARGATQQVDKAEDSLKRLGKAADAMKSAGRALTVGVSLPLVGLAGFAVKAAADMDSLRRALTAMTGSTAETARQMERLKVVARAPGLGFQEAVQGSVNLQAVGFSALQAERALKAFGNAIATTGGGKAELDRVIFQLAQMAAVGKVTAQDLKPIIQTAPAVAKALKELFGTTSAEAISEQAGSFDEFFAALIPKLEQMPSVAGGAKNALANLSDSAFRARAALGDALLPAVVPMVEGFAALLEKTESLNPHMLRTGIAFGAAAAVVGPLSIGIASLATAVGTLVIAGAPLWPILLGGAAITAGVAAFVGLFTKSKLEALAAAGAVKEYTASLAGMNEAQLRAQRSALMGQKSKVAEMIGNLSGGKGNDGRLAQLRKSGMDVVGALAEVDRLLRGLETPAKSTTTTLATGLDSAKDAAKKLRQELERLDETLRKGTRIGIGRTGNRPRGLSEEGKAASQKRRAQREQFVEMGGSLAPVPVPGGSSSGEGGGSFLSDLGQQVRGQILGVVAQFGPLAAVAAALRPVFEGLMDTIGPALSALAAPLRVVGEVIGTLIVPVLRLLFDPLRYLGIVVAMLGESIAAVVGWVFDFIAGLKEGLGNFLVALGELINKLPGSLGNGIIKYGKHLQEGAEQLKDNAAAAREMARGFEQTQEDLKRLKFNEAADAVERFTESLLNVPRVLRLAQIRGQVSAGIIGGSSLTNPKPTDLGGSLPANPIHITVNVDRDGNGEATVERAGRAAERHRMRGGTTRMALAV